MTVVDARAGAEQARRLASWSSVFEDTRPATPRTGAQQVPGAARPGARPPCIGYHRDAGGRQVQPRGPDRCRHCWPTLRCRSRCWPWTRPATSRVGRCWGTAPARASPPGRSASFFRSQSNAAELGGLAPTHLPGHAGCSSGCSTCVIVETVGIGQSELDIRYLADHVYLVLQPLGGDEIQFLKAGIIEIPDSFILNKCDDPAAGQSYYQLRSSLSLAQALRRGAAADPPDLGAHRGGDRRVGVGPPQGRPAALRRRAGAATSSPAGSRTSGATTGRRYLAASPDALKAGFDAAQGQFEAGILAWLGKAER
ncbi:MAG: hypothetical protein V9G10_13100 [Candidatus Nanopelagicales bacterium]